MPSYAEGMWSIMSPQGRLEVLGELNKVAGRDPGMDFDGVSQDEISNIDDFDELPSSLIGALRMIAGPEGWHYPSYLEWCK